MTPASHTTRGKMEDVFEPQAEQGQLIRRATISPDNRYRYRLTRWWRDAPPMTFIMLNPSTADDRIDDPTIRRCMGFAKREGCGGLVVVNLFALRATDPDALRLAGDPFGPDNEASLLSALQEATLLDRPIICGWGTKGGAGVTRLLHLAEGSRAHLQCLGTSKDGYPKHPLYLASYTPLVTYRDFREAA